MKSVGVITEYNPLHNGHIYHINKTKELTGADVLISVMSGNFVQRGEPSVINKYARAKSALQCGANLVIELPSYYTLSSAEFFAYGGIGTLNCLNVENVVFGSECNDIKMLSFIADIIDNEPERFSYYLKKHLAFGLSYPMARSEAFKDYLTSETGSSGSSYDADILIQSLNCPNNILGIEYLRAINKLKCNIQTYTIKRNGDDYNSSDIESATASATAIRKILSAKDNDKEQYIFNDTIKNYIPDKMFEELKEANNITSPVTIDDFSMYFNYKLREIIDICKDKNESAKYLCRYPDVNEALANRIIAVFDDTASISDFLSKLKSKLYTYTRLSRIVMNIILEFTAAGKYNYAAIPYIRILGFDKTGQQYLNSIKKTCPVPIVTKVADYKELLSDDIHASNIYNQVIFNKFGTKFPDEFRQNIIRL